MSVGCIVKGVLIAAVFAVGSFFLAPMLGLTSEIPVGSLVSSGVFVGYLLGALVTWRSSSECSSGGKGSSNVLYVGNIPFKAREDEVQRLFEVYGVVKSVRLVRGGPSRRPKGYGFVEMGSANDVSAALALNGEEFAGRKLRVNEAKDKD